MHLKENILVDDKGLPRLMDFGLGWASEDGATLWQTSRRDSPGTTRYMAPELLCGETHLCTEASDVFAYWINLGWVNFIYKLLCA